MVSMYVCIVCVLFTCVFTLTFAFVVLHTTYIPWAPEPQGRIGFTFKLMVTGTLAISLLHQSNGCHSDVMLLSMCSIFDHALSALPLCEHLHCWRRRRGEGGRGGGGGGVGG